MNASTSIIPPPSWHTDTSSAGYLALIVGPSRIFYPIYMLLSVLLYTTLVLSTLLGIHAALSSLKRRHPHSYPAYLGPPYVKSRDDDAMHALFIALSAIAIGIPLFLISRWGAPEYDLALARLSLFENCLWMGVETSVCLVLAVLLVWGGAGLVGCLAGLDPEMCCWEWCWGEEEEKAGRDLEAGLGVPRSRPEGYAAVPLMEQEAGIAMSGALLRRKRTSRRGLKGKGRKAPSAGAPECFHGKTQTDRVTPSGSINIPAESPSNYGTNARHEAKDVFSQAETVVSQVEPGPAQRYTMSDLAKLGPRDVDAMFDQIFPEFDGAWQRSRALEIMGGLPALAVLVGEVEGMKERLRRWESGPRDDGIRRSMRLWMTCLEGRAGGCREGEEDRGFVGCRDEDANGLECGDSEGCGGNGDEVCEGGVDEGFAADGDEEQVEGEGWSDLGSENDGGKERWNHTRSQ